jgi:hypothetical protein
MRIADHAAACFAAALLFTGTWPLLHSRPAAMPPVSNTSVEWSEAQWAPQYGSPMRLRLSTVEERFARQFPGHIARFAEGGQEWIVRVVNKPTRMLHPATDCFRALGYEIDTPRIRADAKGEHWRCFNATRNGNALKVCERIFDAGSGRWTDTSSWYWSALAGKATQGGGPWWAVTKVEVGG